MALLAWERDGRRGYLFEDGELRVIAEPYYHWMKLSQTDAGELTQTFQRHLSQMDLSETEGMLNPSSNSNTLYTLEEQAQLLVGQYPQGFAGEAWREHFRGDGSKKRLKRHRDAAIAEGQQTLLPERVAQASNNNEHADLWRSICNLLRHTDLVTPGDVKTLEAKVDKAARSTTQALADVLYDDEGPAFAARFDTFVAELKRLLGVTPSWPFAIQPRDCACIQPVFASKASG